MPTQNSVFYRVRPRLKHTHTHTRTHTSQADRHSLAFLFWRQHVIVDPHLCHKRGYAEADKDEPVVPARHFRDRARRRQLLRGVPAVAPLHAVARAISAHGRGRNRRVLPVPDMLTVCPGPPRRNDRVGKRGAADDGRGTEQGRAVRTAKTEESVYQ